MTGFDSKRKMAKAKLEQPEQEPVVDCPLGEDMRDKRIDKAKRVGEPLSVVYSIKVTQSQRIALMRLGPQWIRDQIEATKLFRGTSV